MKICGDCGLQFEKHASYANHIRWEHREESKTFKEKLKVSGDLARVVRYGNIITEIVNCYNCLKEININYREKRGKKRLRYFCNRSCGTKYSNSCKKELSIESRKRISDASKKSWESGIYVNSQIYGNKRFTSKGELELKSLLQNKYTLDEWTSGGSIKYKEESLIRDMYSNKLKVCIEYDGIWHFKDIKGQLAKKQLKDRLLEEWCLKNDFRILRVSDDLWNKNKVEIFKEVEKFCYNSFDLIKKIY
jgi:hypothetical protein